MDQGLDKNLQDNAEAALEVETHSHESHGHIHGPNCSHSHHHTHDPIVRTAAKVGRNDLCPCGSQQKFKKCHGK